MHLHEQTRSHARTHARARTHITTTTTMHASTHTQIRARTHPRTHSVGAIMLPLTNCQPIKLILRTINHQGHLSYYWRSISICVRSVQIQKPQKMMSATWRDGSFINSAQPTNKQHAAIQLEKHAYGTLGRHQNQVSASLEINASYL